MTGLRRICLLGLGEVGQVLAVDLRARGATDIVAWDPLFRSPTSGPARAVAAGLASAASGPVEAVAIKQRMAVEVVGCRRGITGGALTDARGVG